MLCSLKTPRPDKLLNKHLISLAYSLIALTIALVLFLLYPEYRLLLVFSFLLITIICLSIAIKTLSAAEEAISYGGFANELMKNDFEILRIDNAKLEPVIQNDLAHDFFKDTPIISFLEQHLVDSSNNKMSFSRLKTALLNLSSDTVTLNLNIHHDDNTVFTPESYFEISVRPIYLKKTDIFTGRFSVKTIKKSCYILWKLKDISAQHNMEQIFQDERKSLHDFLDYLPVGLYTCRSDYHIEYCNHTFANLLGINREDLISKKLPDILAAPNALPPKQSHWSGNLYFQNSEHQNCEFFVTQESFRDDKDIKFHCVALNNIPNDNELKQNLDKSLDEINWLFNNAPVGIGFIDKNGTILDCNTCVASYFNQSNEQIISHNFLEFINEDDHVKFSKILNSQNNKDFNTELKIKSDNSEKIAILYLQPMQSIRSNQSQLDGFVFYMIDNTQHKKLELQYAQAQKMQAMGQMAGGVAHDFNNLLTAMIGFCDLLLQRHGIGDPSFSDLMQIKQNANRASGLVRQLLAFSRKQPLKPKLIDVTENFVELSQLLKRVLGEQITLKFNHSNDLGYIRVDPVQFSQVFLNLAVNAKDAMNGNGTLTITTHVENLSHPYQFGADTIKPGEFVVIDVKDTGCGIPIENLNRIFEPFFSTKQNVVGSGTGLGLAMVYGIVRQTEGFIKVESIIGKGTTFSVHLPRFENNTEEENINQPTTKEVITARDGSPILTVQEKNNSPININQKLIFGLNVSAIDRSNISTSADNGRDIRILFVEDEDSVRTFAVRALKKKGYDVIGCNSAENALEKLETDTNFNLLITDMVMPGMSGAELAGIVHQKIPDIKIILASGYSEEIARRELASSQEFEFMAKPFSLGDLTQKVFNVLNKK